MPYLFGTSPPEFINYDFVFNVAIKHDWRVRVGDWDFGLTEVDAPNNTTEQIGGRTSIHVGPISFHTNFSGYEVLAVTIIAALFLVGAVSLVIARHGRREGPAA